MIELDSIYNVDCLVGMKEIPDASIDMIFCDLPYGATKNKWDSVIPPDKLWVQYNRIIKPHGAILLFGQGAFTALMIMSNYSMFRYNLIWQKTKPSGFLNASRMPLRSHEDIMVFYKNLPVYNPQKTFGHTPVHSFTKHSSDGSNYGATKLGISGGGSTERYPTSVWQFPSDTQKSALHPTQKPVNLCRYAIRTYSNVGDTVLDNCCGSGSILLAAKLEGRHYIGMDNGVCENAKSKYFQIPWADISKERLKNCKKEGEP